MINSTPPAPLDAAPDSELGRVRARLAARDATIAELTARVKDLGERDAAARRQIAALTVDSPHEDFTEAVAAQLFRGLAEGELRRLNAELVTQREVRRDEARECSDIERQVSNDLRALQQMGVADPAGFLGQTADRLRRALGGGQ